METDPRAPFGKLKQDACHRLATASTTSSSPDMTALLVRFDCDSFGSGGDPQCLFLAHDLLMGAAEEAVVTAFMSAWGDGTQAEPDLDTILPMFTDDAVWQLWVPGGPTLRGRDAIEADIGRQLGFATHMRCGPVSMASNDRQVFTERLDRFISKDVQIDHYLVAVFDISADGRISAWREYFDPEDVNRQIRAASAARREDGSP